MPEALSALDALTMTLPPAFSALSERSARKLRMSGVRGAGTRVDREATTWRTLISPVDGAGVQVVWFIRRAAEQDAGTLLTVITRDPEGIAACFGSDKVSVEHLPPDQPRGSIYNFAQDETVPALQLLESEFDAGRHVVRAALDRHWAAGTLPPLEYRYFNPLLWDTEPPGETMTTPRRATTHRRRWRGCSTIRFSQAGFGETMLCSMPPAG